MGKKMFTDAEIEPEEPKRDQNEKARAGEKKAPETTEKEPTGHPVSTLKFVQKPHTIVSAFPADRNHGQEIEKFAPVLFEIDHLDLELGEFVDSLAHFSNSFLVNVPPS